ncbi:MAG: hypothetical protein HY862_01570 [Chloroflexi bacterium]|nr:hypothetical protein [Chloroflexota bacterium]
MDIHFEAEPTEADFGFIHEQSVASIVAKYDDSIPNFLAGRTPSYLLKSNLNGAA